MSTTINWLAAFMLAFVIAAGCNLDGLDDHQADWDQSTELKALQASQAGTTRRQAAAQALCTQERGPNSEARWTPDGDLVCTTRRALLAVQL